jgi:outer membrane protein OmpA-like peptidoglycan-associated protein
MPRVHYSLSSHVHPGWGRWSYGHGHPGWGGHGHPGWGRGPYHGRFRRWGWLHRPVLGPSLIPSPMVTWAQGCLAQLLGPWVPQDGIMGPDTQRAVQQFQMQQYLPSTGILDDNTVGALQAVCSGQQGMQDSGGAFPVPPPPIAPPAPPVVPPAPQPPPAERPRHAHNAPSSNEISESREYEGGWGARERGFGAHEYEEPQRYAKSCPPYEPGEVAKSKTEAGHLPSDVIQILRGTLIADFGVDWRHTKPSLERDPALKALVTDVISALRKDSSLAVAIWGFSDCVGNERNNAFLRRGRAQGVAQLLLRLAGPDAGFLRSRIVAVEAAEPDDYVADNGTIEGRAQNRGVLIEVVIYVQGKAPGRR